MSFKVRIANRKGVRDHPFFMSSLLSYLQYRLAKAAGKNKMLQKQVLASELLQNADGSIYHLNLFPDELATTIILVGDPDRAPIVASYFDEIEVNKRKREFVVITGRIGKTRVSVISTGIGPSNIDIVLNEVDVLVNVDFATRTVKEKLTKLRIIRLGTCGCLVKEIPVDALIFSTYAFSFGGLLNFYEQHLDEDEKALLKKIHHCFAGLPVIKNAYVARAAESWLPYFKEIDYQGITLTCSGFYGPQHRRVRAELIKQNIFNMANKLQYRAQRVVNLEMETAAIYGLGKVFGHDCCSISTVVANRVTQQVSSDPEKAVAHLIKQVLDRIFE